VNPDLTAKIETFRSKAQQQGIAPEKIEAFIAQKTGQTSPAALPQATPQAVPQATMPQIGMPQAGGFQLTPQQVMSAQLFLPAEQAEALKSAYDIQLKSQEQLLKQQEKQEKEQKALEIKNRTLEAAQALANTKFKGITGIPSIGSYLPNTPEQEAKAAYNQLRSLLTLSNIEILKGTGPISEKETAILENASTRLTTKLTDEAFERELNALIKELGGTPAEQEESKKKVEAGSQPQLLNQALGMGATQPTAMQPTTTQPTGMQPTRMQPTGTQLDQVIQPQQRERDLLDTVIDILPTAGAIVGGLAGGVLGGGVGSLATGAAGTFVGAAGGRQLGEFIQDLTGRQDETSAEAFKESIVDASKAAVADLATGGLIKIGKPIVQGIGKGLASIGDDLALRALKPTKTQSKNFLAKTGKELKDFVIEKGLFKEGTEQVEQLIKPIQKSFDDITNRSGLKIPTGDITKAYTDTIESYKNVGVSGYEDLANQVQKEYDTFLNKYKNTLEIDISEINTLRQKLDDLLSESSYIKDDVKAGADKIARDLYSNVVRNVADSAGLVDDAGRSLKEMGLELQKLYSFKDIAATQKYLGTGTLPIGLTKTIGLAGIGGGVGGLTGEGDAKSIVTGALLSLGLPTVANNPKIIAVLANQLPKIGAAINTVPESQKSKVATDMIRRLLTQMGATEITDLGQELAGVE